MLVIKNKELQFQRKIQEPTFIKFQKKKAAVLSVFDLH